MHLTNKLSVVIFSILISKAISASPCCKNNGNIENAKSCEDGSVIGITCKVNRYLLNPERNSNDTYSIDEDLNGEFLRATQYVVHEPHFCTGQLHNPLTNRTDEVAVICPLDRESWDDENLNETESSEDTKTEYNSMFFLFAKLFNLASALTFLATAAIYYFLPEVQDLQGTCYFHFTFIAGIAHTTILYLQLFTMPDSCLANVYLLFYLIRCGFLWTSVVCHTTWKYTRNIYAEDEKKLLREYKIYAYGEPLLLIALCWIHVHLEASTGMKIVLDCFIHSIKIYELYLSVPILITLIANFVMFVDAQIKIWKSHAVNLRDTKLTFKIIKYRLLMYAKLFFIMGIPWTVFILINLLDVNMVFLEDPLELLLYGEGVPIFIILVLLRKRVLRGIANRWLCTTIFPERWKTMRDSETEEEDEGQNESAITNAQVRYEPQNADEGKSDDSSVSIIVLENPNAINVQG